MNRRVGEILFCAVAAGWAWIALTIGATAAAPPVTAATAPESPLGLRKAVLTLKIAPPPSPVPPDAPPSLASPYRLAAGDFFGEGRDALAVLHRAPEGGQGHVLRVYRAEALQGPGGEPAAVVEVPDLLVDGLVAADVTGNGLDELWLGHSPSLGCLEWDGERFRPLKPWGFWQNKPVTVARLAGTGGSPDRVLAMGAYYSPEVGIDLIAAWWRDKMWGKESDVRANAFFSPADRLAAADLTGDGAADLVVAASRRRTVLPVAPLTIAGLAGEKVIATFPGLVPDAIAVADLDGNGVAELYTAENSPAVAEAGEASLVRGFSWDGTGFAPVGRWGFPEMVADLAAGDLDGDGRPALLVGLVREIPEAREPQESQEGQEDQVGLEVVLTLLGKGESGW